MKTDLNDIERYYLSQINHSIWVAVSNTTHEILGMIAVRANQSWKNTQKIKTNVRNMDKNRYKNILNLKILKGNPTTDSSANSASNSFASIYQQIDEIIDILETAQNPHTKGIQSIVDTATDNTNSNTDNIAEIMRLCVSVNARRIGIASALMETLIKFCINHGYKTIVATTMNVLNEAMEFYEAAGFQMIGNEKCGNSSNSELYFVRYSMNL